ERAHAGGGEIECGWRPKSPDADDENAGRLQAFLPAKAHFGEKNLPAIAGQLGRAQHRRNIRRRSDHLRPCYTTALGEAIEAFAAKRSSIGSSSMRCTSRSGWTRSDPAFFSIRPSAANLPMTRDTDSRVAPTSSQSNR